MRQTLAIVLLRLLGTRVVQEAAEPVSCTQIWDSVSTSDFERSAEAAAASAGEGLFNRLLSVLHALLSSTWAVWLKPPWPLSKGQIRPLQEIPSFDQEAVERMQVGA
jgi:hypothetical protein